MKRIYIAIGLILLIFVFSCVTIIHLQLSEIELVSLIEEMNSAVRNEEYNQAKSLATDFKELWYRKERIMVSYLRHTDLDFISTSVSRLEPLLEYEMVGEFLSETIKMKDHIKHITSSEIPTIRNII